MIFKWQIEMFERRLQMYHLTMEEQRLFVERCRYDKSNLLSITAIGGAQCSSPCEDWEQTAPRHTKRFVSLDGF
jgi:hypothetical protein